MLVQMETIVLCGKYLWLIHNARERNWDRYREQDWHKREQWVLVFVPVSDQCEHFYTVLYFPYQSRSNSRAVWIHHNKGPRQEQGPGFAQCELAMNHKRPCMGQLNPVLHVFKPFQLRFLVTRTNDWIPSELKIVEIWKESIYIYGDRTQNVLYNYYIIS